MGRCLASPGTTRAFRPQVRIWTSGEEESASRVTVAAGRTSATVRGLRSNLAYHGAVRAYNSAGAGPFSATVTATTRKTRTYDRAPRCKERCAFLLRRPKATASR